MVVVNVVSCELDEQLAQGAFRFAGLELTERLGARVIGATVYEMQAGDTLWPYHYHHGVEEWMYVVSGAPVLRDPAGERALAPGALVAFPSGPAGAHGVRGPGRIVIFSAGARGFGEGFVTVYPDSDKIGAAPGVKFRRADALEAWAADTPPSSGTADAERMPALGGETWEARRYELAPGEATAAYHYEWCREQWVLVVGGALTLRHSEGETPLRAGDVACFGEGPDGAHRLSNPSGATAQLVIFSTPVHRPMSAFYPEDGTVEIRISDHDGFRFRIADQIEDYWDGEPGAGEVSPPGPR